MSIYNKFNGRLTFETEDEANEQFKKLLNDNSGVFWLPEEYLPSNQIFVEGSKIRIESKGFRGGETYYDNSIFD